MYKQDIKYFLAANTSKGYRSFFKQTEDYVSKFFKTALLPQDIISDIIQKAKTEISEQELSVEIILNPLTNKETGIIIPEFNSGFVNLGAFETFEYDRTLVYSKKNIKDITESINLAYKYFGEALKIHDEWEKIYIDNMNFEILDSLKDDMIQKLLPQKSANKPGLMKDRFLGSSTYNGPVDYIEEITAETSKRYFIKGRPGTGKSTFMKGIAKEAINRGFDVDVYHCAFDPDSIDMIIVKDLSLSIFDSTSPHEHFPSKANDEIIDIYDIAVNDSTDEKYKDQLLIINSNYKKEVSKAINELKKAKNILDYSDDIMINMNLQEKKDLKNRIFDMLLG